MNDPLHDLLQRAVATPGKPPDMATMWALGQRRRRRHRQVIGSVSALAALLVLVAFALINPATGSTRSLRVTPVAPPLPSSTTIAGNPAVGDPTGGGGTAATTSPTSSPAVGPGHGTSAASVATSTRPRSSVATTSPPATTSTGGAPSGPGPTVTTPTTSGPSTTTTTLKAGTSLTASATYPVPGATGLVLLADLNGDGHADIVTVGSGGAGVLLGRPDGTFAPPMFSAAGTGPTVSAVGDFNGDGRPDLAVADNPTKSLLMMPGRGDGTFAAPEPVTAASGSGWGGMAVADFNGDSIQDLAVTNGTTLQILLGRSSGTPVQGPTPPAGVAGLITSGDYNEDHHADIAVTAGGPNGGYLLLGRGDGTFTKASFHGAAGAEIYTTILTTDINHDGHQDIVEVLDAPVMPGHGFTIHLGRGDATFDSTHGATKSDNFETNGLAVGDFNGDGTSDVVLTEDVGNRLLQFDGQGNGNVAAPSSYPLSAPRGIVTADINGDGRADVIVMQSNSTIVVMRGT